MEKVEKQLKIILYIMFIIMMLIGIMGKGVCYVFSLLSLHFFLIYLTMQLSVNYPKDMMTWKGLKNLTWKKVWNVIKL